MYVRMITYSLRPSVGTDIAETIYEQMRDFMQPLAGYQGISLLINEDQLEAVSLSYWQDQASAVEAGSKILPLLMERTEEFVDRPPEVSGFDLVRQDLA